MYLILADSIWSTVGSTLGAALLPTLSVIVAAALVALAKKGIDALGIKRSKDVDGMIEKYIPIGIGYAERWASSKLSGEGKPASEDKLAIAVKTVMGELDQSGITGVAEDLIVGRIEAALEGDSKKA